MAYEYFRSGQIVTSGTLNAMGRVGQVVFSATRDTAQSIADTAAGNAAAAGALSWETIEQDDLGGWASGSPTRYTVQTAGWYELSGGIGFASNATGSRTCAWAVNGTIVDGCHAQRLSANAATTHHQNAVTRTVDLAVGDYVELWAGQSSGAALNTTTGGPRPSVCIKYVRPLDT